MNGQEKLFFLVNKLRGQQSFTPKDKALLIHRAEHLKNVFLGAELDLALEKLSEEGLLVVEAKPSNTAPIYHPLSPRFNDMCYKIKLTPKFDSYVRQLQNAADYRSFSGLEPLEQKTQTTPKKMPSAYPPRYDDEHHAIVFQNIIIAIPPNTNEEELCRIIFKSKAAIKKNWDFDEIAERVDEYSAEKHGDYYGARRRINNKIKEKTGVKNLLVGTTKTVQINPSYL